MKFVSFLPQPTELWGLLDTDTKVHLLLMHNIPSRFDDWYFTSPQAFKAIMAILFSKHTGIFWKSIRNTWHSCWKLWEVLTCCYVSIPCARSRESPVWCRGDETCTWLGWKNERRQMAERNPPGPVLELSQVASGARTLGEMRGEEKIQLGIIIEGAFCCPWMDRAFGLQEEWAPLVSFPHCSSWLHLLSKILGFCWERRLSHLWGQDGERIQRPLLEKHSMGESNRHRDEKVSKKINTQLKKCIRSLEVRLHNLGHQVWSRRGHAGAKQEEKPRTSA